MSSMAMAILLQRQMSTRTMMPKMIPRMTEKASHVWAWKTTQLIGILLKGTQVPMAPSNPDPMSTLGEWLKILHHDNVYRALRFCVL